MRIDVLHPNIEKFQIRMDRNDPYYGKCMWADILIDYDNYSILALTDCGNYSYRWPVSKFETFRELCLRMLDDEEYLLSKFSKQSEFSIEESRLLFADLHKDDEQAYLISKINDMYACTAEEWVEALESHGVDDAWDYVVKEYPRDAVTFVYLLKNIVLPEMRKEQQKHESE